MYAALVMQTSVQSEPTSGADKRFRISTKSLGSLEAAKPGSDSVQCIQPKQACAWKASWANFFSSSIAERRGGIKSDRVVFRVDVAVVAVPGREGALLDK